MRNAAIIRPLIIRKSVIMSAASLGCALLLALSAMVKIPIPGSPVPATLQTFALLAMAGLLGRYYALQMVVWYLALGIIGFPFFAEGSGWKYMMGATGGYIWGFFLAAWIVSFFQNRVDNWYERLSVYLAAGISIYVTGLLQLKIVTGETWMNVLYMGFYPFIIMDLFKACFANLGVRATQRVLGRK